MVKQGIVVTVDWCFWFSDFVLSGPVVFLGGMCGECVMFICM